MSIEIRVVITMDCDRCNHYDEIESFGYTEEMTTDEDYWRKKFVARGWKLDVDIPIYKVIGDVCPDCKEKL